MKGELDKRIFLIVLLLALATVICTDLFTSKSKDENDKEEKPETETVTVVPDAFRIEELTDGMFVVNGSGTLEADTLSKLFKKNGILTTDIVHLILGDEIDDIGYNCLVQFPYMESLKIGAGINRIRNGAVRNCPALAWVYIPKTVQHVGVDFLYDCPNATVVMEGNASELEITADISNVLEQVDSFEAMERKAKNPLFEFDCQSLYSTGSRTDGKVIVLKAGETQFGPYTPIPAGMYRIEVSGSGFEGLTEESIYVQPNSYYSVLPEKTSIMESLIRYEIEIPTELYKLELGLHNTKNSEIEIHALCIYRETVVFELPSILAVWWDGGTIADGL